MIINFSMVPMGTGESLSKEVAKVIELVDSSGLPYKMHPMGTVIEGDWDEVFDLLKRCQMRLKETAPRVLTTIIIDDRKGKKGRIDGKVASVEAELGKKVRQ